MPPPPAHRMSDMPVWHNALLANSLRLTYHCPALLKRGVMRWGDLVEDSAIPLVLWELLAPTWQPVYFRTVGEILGSSDQYQGFGELGTVVDVEEDVVVHVTHAAACAAAATTSVAGVWTAPPTQVGQRFHPAVPVEETACGHAHGAPGGEAVPVRLSGGGP